MIRRCTFFFALLATAVATSEFAPPPPPPPPPHHLLTDGRSSFSTTSLFTVVDAPSPTLTWRLQSPQSAYEIVVNYSNNQTWTSGCIRTNNTLAATYQGRELHPDEEATWQVRIWASSNADTSPTNWSQPTTFRMGRKETDWDGVWITLAAPLSTAQPPPAEQFNNNCSSSPYGDHPNPILRTTFATTATVKRAVLHIAGLGYYRTTLDGTNIPGDTYLDPEWTSFDQRIGYSTHDVTHQLTSSGPGQHTLTIELGNGWWSPLPLKFWGSIDITKSLLVGSPMLRCDLVVIEMDGGVEKRTVIASHANVGQEHDHTSAPPTHGVTQWEGSDGPYLRNNIYLGTVYNASRTENVVWSTARIKNVHPVVLSSLGALLPASVPPIRAFEMLRATETKIPGVYDMGRNFAGTFNVTLVGPLTKGASVTFVFGEVLWPNGTVNVMTSVAGQIKHEGMGGVCSPAIAVQQDVYLSSGLLPNEVVSFVPRFTWHGFRYVSIVVVDGGGSGGSGGRGGSNNGGFHRIDSNHATIQSLVGIALRTDVDVVGSFEVTTTKQNHTSAEQPPRHILDDVFTMVLNTHSSNMMSIQSDCPHRERFGYGGDLLATAETGMHLFDLALFYQKRVVDYSDAQRNDGSFTETSPYVGIADAGVGANDGSGPIGWGSVQPVLQVWLFQHYGNQILLNTSYGSTLQWISMLSNAKEARIEHGLSDWMNVEPYNVQRLSGHVFKWMNYQAWSNINRVLGNAELASGAAQNASMAKDRMNALFLQNNGTYADGTTFQLTQCGQALPLYYDLVPKASMASAMSKLNVSLYELGKGFAQSAVGMFCVLPLLSSIALDVAYEIATGKEYPSYGYMLERGATTVWESWLYSNNTYSHNHPMFSSVVVWMFQQLGGIRQMSWSVGWSHVLLRPRSPCSSGTKSSSKVEGGGGGGGGGGAPPLPGVKVGLETVRGRIESNWTRGGEEGSFLWSFRIPFGSVGTVDLPGKDVYEVSAGVHVVRGVDLCEKTR